MDKQQQPRDWALLLTRLTAGLCILLAVSVLAGWYARIPILVRWVSASPAMQIDAALALLLSALALLACVLGQPRWALVALLPTLFGLARLVASWLGFPWRIEWLLFQSPAADLKVGHMAPVTAGCFFLLGTCLLLQVGPRKAAVRSLLAALGGTVVAALSAVVFLNFLTGRGVPREVFFTMAAPTAASLMLLGAGVFALAWREATADGRKVPGWLAGTAGLAVGTATLVLSMGAASEDRQQLIYATRLAKQRFCDNLRVQMRYHGTALRNAVPRWQRPALRPADEQEFRQEIVDHNLKGLTFAQRLTPAQNVIWSVPPTDWIPNWRQTGARSEIERLLKEAREQHWPIYSRPFHLLDEGESIALAVPAFMGEQFTGWLLGFFDSRQLIGTMLGPDLLPGFGIAVWDGETELYRREDIPPGLPSMLIREEVVERDGVAWRVQVWPGPKLLVERRSPLPAALLVGGWLTALLLAVAVQLAQVAWRRTQEATQAARDLAQEFAEHRRAEEARRHTELRFRALFNQTFELIGLLRPDGMVLEVNQSILDFRGLTQVDGAGRPFWETPWLDSSAETRDQVRLAVARAAGGGFARGEITVLDRQGVPRTLDFSLKPIGDEAGVVSLLIAEARDVTDQKQLAEQLRQAQKMEAVGQLAGGIAHDFNNLLTVITGYSEILRETFSPSDPLQSSIEAIARAAARAAELTRQLLAFSRKQLLTPKLLDLGPVIHETEGLLSRLLGEDIKVVVRLSPRPGCVFADPTQIQQILLNLAVNARDAMPCGGQLTIATDRRDLDEAYARQQLEVRPGSYVLLSVSDTGCGMDEKTRARIFEPFFTTKEIGKGTGLGLAMVYGIIKQSEGHIEVESEPGRGTTFRIYLPLIEEAAPVGRAVEKAASRPGGTETVLLVDDDPGVCAMGRLILQNGGYTALVAQGPEEALALAQQHRGPIHLLMTDVVMPRMSGRELAERLAKARPEMRVLYLSGHSEEAILRHGIIAEKVALVGKPFAVTELLQKVRQILGTAQPAPAAS